MPERWVCRLFLTAVFFLAAARCDFAQGIYNGGFDRARKDMFPCGWRIWGVTPGRTDSSSGWFRVEKIKGTFPNNVLSMRFTPRGSSYIVTDPYESPVSCAGSKYVFTFRIRAQRAARVVFSVFSYKDIHDLTGFRQILAAECAAGPEWKQYSFTLEEGLDFFAASSKCLMAGFMKAEKGLREPVNVWADDVGLDRSWRKSYDRLLDFEETVPLPLKHRLKQGNKLSITIDSRKVIARAGRRAAGVSFHKVTGFTLHPFDDEGRYSLPFFLEMAIKDLRLPMTRFYGLGSERYSLEDAIDKAALMCEKAGIPQEFAVLELEDPAAQSMLPASRWAQCVRYSLEKGYKFRMWEVGNEPYSGYWDQKSVFKNPQEYISHIVEVSSAVRNEQPEALVGAAIAYNDLDWGNKILKRAAGWYDFIVGHYYSYADVRALSFEDVTLAANWKKLRDIMRIDALIKRYNGKKHVAQYDTEWGLHSMNGKSRKADREWRNANVVGAVHRAVRLIYYARENIVEGASSWSLLSHAAEQGFCVLASQTPAFRSWLYWLYFYFNRHVGEWVLDVRGRAPWYRPSAQAACARDMADMSGPQTPVLATLSEDAETIYIIIANGSMQSSYPAKIRIKGFTPGKARCVRLGGRASRIDGPPLLTKFSDAVSNAQADINGRVVSFELEPRSVMFLAIERGAQASA